MSSTGTPDLAARLAAALAQLPPDARAVLGQALAPAAPVTEGPGPQEAPPAPGASEAPAPSTEEIVTPGAAAQGKGQGQGVRASTGAAPGAGAWARQDAQQAAAIPAALHRQGARQVQGRGDAHRRRADPGPRSAWGHTEGLQPGQGRQQAAGRGRPGHGRLPHEPAAG